MCRFYNAAGLLEIVRQEHEDVDARGQKIFDLLELQVVVAVGGSRDGLCSKLPGALLKFVDVRLPALALRVL